ncbi:protein TSSC4 [Diorhabda sublineata]|uniref:protein TSSC4 n=1 Tax=Diorhabda sublineata TaxID=1163346 RepID=UPI0024E065E0|nr:protein TSSC4 [Diorhabda sublineata]
MSGNIPFTLKSDNDEFSLRQKNIFEQLTVLENNKTKLQNDTQMEVDTDVDDTHKSNPKLQRAITKRLRGKESIFKRPQNPVPKNYIKKMPDFKKNPHKWTKYTLDDVADEDMSDKSNTKTALSFLEELKERKDSDPLSVNAKADLTQKVVFKKHISKVSNSQSDDDSNVKASFRSSKVIMPEYVIGQKVKKEKKRKNVVKGKELKLDHLLEEDGIDDV